MKGLIELVRINANERKALIKQGVPIGENGITSTHSHHSSWYLAETERNMQILEKIRTPLRG